MLDSLLIAGAICGGLFLRFGGATNVSPRNGVLAAILAPTWLLLLAIGGAYEHDRVRTGTEQAKAVFEASVRMAAFTAFALYLANTQVSRGFYLLALPGGFLALLAGRYAAQAFLHRARRRGRCLHRVLAVGNVDDILHLLAQVERKAHHGLNVVGACTVTNKAELGPGVPVLGVPADAGQAAAEAHVDTVAVTSTGVLGRDGLRRLAWDLEGSDTGLLLAPHLTDVAGPRITVRPLGALSLLQVSEPKFSGASRVLKGAFDRVLAALALFGLLPVFLVVAAAIKLDSKGPVFFRQTRTGLGGRPFQLVKFRSMVPAAEDLLIDLTDKNECGGVLFKIKRDPRVTRVGRLLRRVSIDELPQLWNVLTGQMSLVGPRPPLPTEVELYAADVRRRLLVKPGLTGLWQVSGRSDLTWEESVRLDLYYVENWSLLMDFMIMVRTVGAIVAGRGAY
jgi:exopolysaccharide biosynthesis polyprenyl glycosylphosphotransferase